MGSSAGSGPRSLLFVPGNRPERFAKAMASGADAVIVDLEDAVGVSSKPVARENVADAVALAAQHAVRLLVRVNAVGTEWHEKDVEAGAAAAGIVLPKCERPDVVADVEARLVAAAGGTGPELAMLVETAAGVLAAREIAAAPSRLVRRMCFGTYDFALDMGVTPAEAGSLLTMARAQVTLAARAGGIQAIDAPWADIRDQAGLRRQADEARTLGFLGKLAVHPAQVQIVNDAFTPSAEQLAWARRVVEAFHEAERTGVAAITLDDEMIDYPIARRARDVLARADGTGPSPSG